MQKSKQMVPKLHITWSSSRLSHTFATLDYMQMDTILQKVSNKKRERITLGQYHPWRPTWRRCHSGQLSCQEDLWFPIPKAHHHNCMRKLLMGWAICEKVNKCDTKFSNSRWVTSNTALQILTQPTPAQLSISIFRGTTNKSKGSICNHWMQKSQYQAECSHAVCRKIYVNNGKV